ncbi:hypothetical protein K438DRAFT_1755330 [Mycena galopus ATCC 62051]|nr:hypothetical protein K438DRAFT_1755330 [Mycena galopus ATCC 62051]
MKDFSFTESRKRGSTSLRGRVAKSCLTGLGPLDLGAWNAIVLGGSTMKVVGRQDTDGRDANLESAPPLDPFLPRGIPAQALYLIDPGLGGATGLPGRPPAVVGFPFGLVGLPFIGPSLDWLPASGAGSPRQHFRPGSEITAQLEVGNASEWGRARMQLKIPTLHTPSDPDSARERVPRPSIVWNCAEAATMALVGLRWCFKVVVVGQRKQSHVEVALSGSVPSCRAVYNPTMMG